MRVQALILAVLVSLYLWVGTIDAARQGYRFAQYTGALPNLHITEKLSRLL